jgi:hypothetical protein
MYFRVDLFKAHNKTTFSFQRVGFKYGEFLICICWIFHDEDWLVMEMSMSFWH